MRTCHPIQYGDPRVIFLDRGDYTTCTVILKGAAITSWRIQNEEQIFISRISKLDDYNKYRGGITLVFPHYTDWNYGRPHGFARDLMWRVKKGPELLKNGDVFLELYLPCDKYTRSEWNYDFELRYSIILQPMQLETRISVINTSLLSSLEFHFEQHTYLRVMDISKCQFGGLQGSVYLDRLIKGPENIFEEVSDRLDLGQPLNRVYDSPKNVLQLINDEENKKIKIKTQNLPDQNLWNPQHTKIVDDLDVDETKYFIAFDSGNVFSKRQLPPNSFWTASETYEVVKTESMGPKFKNFFDYFKGYC